MTSRRQALAHTATALPLLVAASNAIAQASAPAAAQPATVPPAATPLFALELRTGPAWDTQKKTHEQAHFREHSAHLKRLRDEGRLVMGARLAERGLLVLAAASEEQARGWVEQDPAVQHKTFVYEMHALQVFYPGCLGATRRSG